MKETENAAFGFHRNRLLFGTGNISYASEEIVQTVCNILYVSASIVDFHETESSITNFHSPKTRLVETHFTFPSLDIYISSLNESYNI